MLDTKGMTAGTPEFELLLDCLRRSLQSDSTPPASPLAIPENLNWPALLALTEQHVVLALVYPQLAPHATEEFAAAWHSSWAHAQFLAAELESVLAAFAKAGIEVMPLKGPVLAEALFGDVAARASIDLDVLVQRHHLATAQTVLTSSGFEAEPITKPISGLAYDLPFRRGEVLLELHSSFGRPELCPLNSDEAWSRSQTATFRGQPIRIMAQEDSILYLSYHLLRHDCARLQWIADLARALAILAANDPGEALLNSARNQGMDELLFFSSALAAETLQTSLPAALSTALLQQPKIVESAREFLAQNLARQDPGDSSAARPVHAAWSFYSTERSPWRRWTRRLRELAPTQADRLWAKSMHIPSLIVPPLLPLVRLFRVLGAYGIAGAWRNFMQGTR
ncbi:MAG: nucleotidyltransferase family protein [Terracidiphilus sp.]|jgi:hypothetical protein